MYSPRKILFVLFFLFSASLLTASDKSDDFPFVGEVIAARLNIRPLPEVSKQSQPVTYLKKGAQVNVIGQSGTFYKISAPANTYAWISENDVEKSEGEIKVISDNASLRLDSRINSLKVGEINKDATFKFVKYYLGWYKISATSNGTFYAAKKYVKKIAIASGNKTINPIQSKEAAKAYCDAKFKEATFHINKQHELLKQNKIANVSFEEVVLSYDEAAQYAVDQKTKKFAEDNAKRYREIQNLLVGIQVNTKAWEEQSKKAKELLALIDKLNSKKDYIFIGTLDTVGLFADRPGEFKVVANDGRIKCFLKTKADDAESADKLLNMYKRKVGITGTLVEDEKWRVPIVIIDEIDEIVESTEEIDS